MKTIRTFSLLVLTIPLVGCFQSTGAPKTADVSSPDATTEEATPRKTLNETTQNVLQLDVALAEGAILAPTDATASDPISASQDAYRTSVGKLAAMSVLQTINIRNAQSINDPKPLKYEDFMKEIVKPEQPDGLRFAMLPYYQEYAWDLAGQKLVVVEFPARKEKRREQLDNN